MFFVPKKSLAPKYVSRYIPVADFSCQIGLVNCPKLNDIVINNLTDPNRIKSHPSL